MLFRSDRKSTRLNSSHLVISYAVFCLKKKKTTERPSQHSTAACQSRSRSRCVSTRVCTSAHGRSEVLLRPSPLLFSSFFFFFNDTATTEIYTLSLHDALPIYQPRTFALRLGAAPAKVAAV